MKVSIVIVTYDSMRYLPDFLDSVFNQTYYLGSQTPPDIFIVDNASSDKTTKYIKDNFPTVHMLKNVNNIGLCRAWNQGIKMTSGEYILIMNPDLVLHKDYIKESVRSLDSDQTMASVGGKLYQLKINALDMEEGLATLEKTNILDTTGIVCFKNRRFIERGAGETDHGQYNTAEPVFGISGACVMYRRSALEKVKFAEEYFDEDFFMYKEDIDLAWRLRLNGWINYYNPEAIAYHHRRAKSLGKVKSYSIIKHRRQKEDFVNYHSYKNHFLMLKKNTIKKNLFKRFPHIFFYELKKLIYLLIFENTTLRKTISDMFRLRKTIKKKRQFNSNIRRVKAEEIEQWFI
jgi:GT2 family glycosyltransferase